jgi:hypothetical protein
MFSWKLPNFPKHYQENEKDEEDVSQKESWSKCSVWGRQSVEVEISENQSEESKNGITEVAVVGILEREGYWSLHTLFGHLKQIF